MRNYNSIILKISRENTESELPTFLKIIIIIVAAINKKKYLRFYPCRNYHAKYFSSWCSLYKKQNVEKNMRVQCSLNANNFDVEISKMCPLSL